MLKVAAELSVSIGDSPSEYDNDKSADTTEVVEGSLYPDDGAVVPPTEIEVLVGGKRKGGRTRKIKLVY